MNIGKLEKSFNFQNTHAGQMSWSTTRLFQGKSTITTPPEKKSFLSRIFDCVASFFKKLFCTEKKQEEKVQNKPFKEIQSDQKQSLELKQSSPVNDHVPKLSEISVSLPSSQSGPKKVEKSVPLSLEQTIEENWKKENAWSLYKEMLDKEKDKNKKFNLFIKITDFILAESEPFKRLLEEGNAANLEDNVASDALKIIKGCLQFSSENIVQDSRSGPLQACNIEHNYIIYKIYSVLNDVFEKNETFRSRLYSGNQHLSDLRAEFIEVGKKVKWHQHCAHYKPSEWPEVKITPLKPAPEPYEGFEKEFTQITDFTQLHTLIEKAKEPTDKFLALDRIQDSLLNQNESIKALKKLANTKNLSNEQLEEWIKNNEEELGKCIKIVNYCYTTLGLKTSEAIENITTRKCLKPKSYVLHNIYSVFMPFLENKTIKSSKNPTLIDMVRFAKELQKFEHDKRCAHILVEKGEIK